MFNVCFPALSDIQQAEKPSALRTETCRVSNLV